MTVRIGFTGSSKIVNEKQCDVFVELLTAINNKEGISEFHHGDCIEGDKKAHNLVRQHFKSARIFVHPPIKHEKRAFCVGDETYPPKDYLVRDRKMIDNIDILFATPCDKKEILRSGTWYTVRYARKRNKTIYIIYPNGKCDIEKKDNAT